MSNYYYPNMKRNFLKMLKKVKMLKSLMRLMINKACLNMIKMKLMKCKMLLLLIKTIFLRHLSNILVNSNLLKIVSTGSKKITKRLLLNLIQKRRKSYYNILLNIFTKTLLPKSLNISSFSSKTFWINIV